MRTNGKQGTSRVPRRAGTDFVLVQGMAGWKVIIWANVYDASRDASLLSNSFMVRTPTIMTTTKGIPCVMATDTKLAKLPFKKMVRRNSVK